METETVCFPPPLDTCVPLSYSRPEHREGQGAEDDILRALRQSAPAGCYLCELDALLEEDWE